MVPCKSYSHCQNSDSQFLETVHSSELSLKRCISTGLWEFSVGIKLTKFPWHAPIMN